MRSAPFRCLPDRTRHTWKRKSAPRNGVLVEHCVCGGKRFFRHTGGQFGGYALDPRSIRGTQMNSKSLDVMVCHVVGGVMACLTGALYVDHHRALAALTCASAAVAAIVVGRSLATMDANK